MFRRASEARDQRLAPADDAIRHEGDAAASLDRIRQEEGANFGVIAGREASADGFISCDRSIRDRIAGPLAGRIRGSGGHSFSRAFCCRRIPALARERFPADAFPRAVAITRATLIAAGCQRRPTAYHRQREN